MYIYIICEWRPMKWRPMDSLQDEKALANHKARQQAALHRRRFVEAQWKERKSHGKEGYTLLNGKHIHCPALRVCGNKGYACRSHWTHAPTPRTATTKRSAGSCLAPSRPGSHAKSARWAPRNAYRLN